MIFSKSFGFNMFLDSSLNSFLKFNEECLLHESSKMSTSESLSNLSLFTLRQFTNDNMFSPSKFHYGFRLSLLSFFFD